MKSLRRLVSFCFVAVFCTLLPALSNAEDDEPKCTVKNSPTVSIEGLQRESAAYEGECVKLSGLQLDNIIFQRRDDIYRHLIQPNSRKPRVVGIAYDGKRWDSETVAQVTVLGRVVDCGAQQRRYARSSSRIQEIAAKTGEIILTHHYGFCAYNKGPALYLDDIVTRTPVRMERLTKGHKLEKLGDLQPVPRNFDYDGKVGFLVDIALKEGCDTSFEPDDAMYVHADVGYQSLFVYPGIANRLDKRDEMLADICGKTGSETQLFVLTPTSSWRIKFAKLDMLICTCRIGNCADKWPVALIDTNWSKKRPYFCQRVTYAPRKISYDADTDKPVELEDWYYEFPQDNGLPDMPDEGWFVEPAATAN